MTKKTIIALAISAIACTAWTSNALAAKHKHKPAAPPVHQAEAIPGVNPMNNALSIVAINNNTSSKSLSFFISGNAPCSLTPYETSASKSLGQGSAVSVSQSRVTVTLNAQSVTTFVGAP